METVRVGMREFREKLAGYLESDTPLAIMRHGQTLGYYIPAQKRSRKAELEAMRAAAKDLDKMIESWSASELQRAAGFFVHGRPVLGSSAGGWGWGGSVAWDCGVCAACGKEANSVGAGKAQRESRYFPKSVSEIGRA